MSFYAEDQEIAAGDDQPFEADYNQCEEAAAPNLAGMTFQFTAVPKSGPGATITKSCNFTGTVIKWAIAAADLTGRVGEIFRCKLRRIDAGFASRWVEFTLKVVD